MDEVAWGPGAGGGSTDSADRSRSAALLARLGGARPSKLRRLSAVLLSAGFLAIAAAQVVPWARIGIPGVNVTDVTSDRSGVAREIGISDGQTILQFSYFITAAMMLALCGGAIFASPRTRRVLGGTALGAIGGHVLLLLPLVKVPARLYGFGLDSFGDVAGSGLKVMRDVGMWFGVGAAALLAAAVVLGLLSDRRPSAGAGPADPDGPSDGERVSDLNRPYEINRPYDGDRLSDHDRPSSQYRSVADGDAVRPSRTPSNQFAFEGHADLPPEPEAPTRPDHSMYQRPRQDTDLGAR